MGQVMQSLPVDIHIARLIVLGHCFGVLLDAVIIGKLPYSQNQVAKLFQRDFQRSLLPAIANITILVTYIVDQYTIYNSG